MLKRAPAPPLRRGEGPVDPEMRLSYQNADSSEIMDYSTGSSGMTTGARQVWYWPSQQSAENSQTDVCHRLASHVIDEAWLYGRKSASEVARQVVPSTMPSEQQRELIATFAQSLSPVGTAPRRSRPPIDVIVCSTFQRITPLVRCIRSILSSTYTGFRLIIVRSGPRLLDLPDDILADDRVHRVDETQLGLSRARNRGWEASQAPLVAFTDDDVVVEPDWLDEIEARFHSLPEVGCVTGLVVPAELLTPAQYRLETVVKVFVTPLTAFTLTCPNPKAVRRHVVITYLGGSQPPPLLVPIHIAAGHAGAGANMAFRRSALPSKRPFNVTLGAGTPSKGGEEILCFAHILASGGSIAYSPVATVHHFHRTEESELREKVREMGISTSATLAVLLREDLRYGAEWAAAKAGLRLRPSTGTLDELYSGLGTLREPDLLRLYQAGLLLGPFHLARSVLRARFRPYGQVPS